MHGYKWPINSTRTRMCRDGVAVGQHGMAGEVGPVCKEIYSALLTESLDSRSAGGGAEDGRRRDGNNGDEQSFYHAIYEDVPVHV